MGLAATDELAQQSTAFNSRASTAAGSASMRNFTLTQQQIETFTTQLVKSFVTGNIPFAFIENDDFVGACAAIGVKLPTRKTLSTKYIPILANEAGRQTNEIIAKAKWVDASSDGWRKKHCEQGAALNNVMALLHDRAVFHDAVNVSAVRKHAPAIQQFLIDSSKALVGEADQDLERLCGWVIDNTKANWSAMLELEKEYPKWIMRGCFCHGLNLLMKDFAKAKRFPGSGGYKKATGLYWLERTVARCNLIANFIQDCGPAKAQV
jgi:hypothetical protein